MIFSIGEAFRSSDVAIADHLWQSTVFGLAAACVTLLLSRNAARLRFFIWFLASVKFLFPFALLEHVGSILSNHVATGSQKSLASVIVIASQPFRHGKAHEFSQHNRWDQFSRIWPTLVGTLWVAGTTIVLLIWWLRWLQVAPAKKAATLLTRGVEVDLLRSLIDTSGSARLPILVSEMRVEPGVFGIARPVLLWPINISKELDEPQIRSILAHELWHVRRRDNLTAAVQMFVEALFWFHPLIWWFGSMQMEERERACDEGVLALGSTPAVYAEGILTICRFCVEAPPPCVAGVNGSNLKKRITRIMNIQNVARLNRTRKFALSTLALGAIGVPVLLGVTSSPQAGAQLTPIEVSSTPLQVTAIRRNVTGDVTTQIKHTAEGTSILNTTVQNLIELAYHVKQYQLTGGPAWLNQDRFDILYTGGEPRGMIYDAALRDILAQKFRLVLRRETKPGPVFALVVASGGLKFPRVTPQNAPGTDEPLLSMRVMQKDGQGVIAITGGTEGLAESLSSQVGRPVVDKTGLTGIYSINFHWATASANAGSIASDLQQQLGLSLAPQEGPVETSIIESIALPTGS